MSFRTLLSPSILVATLILSACTSLYPIRPVEKVGLVAPFEGLYRRTGYEALGAVRQALAESSAHAVDILPVALDDSADASRMERSMEKLLVDPQVKAIVGPLTPELSVSMDTLPTDNAIAWFAPYAVDPSGGFVDPRVSDVWARGLIAEIGNRARGLGAERLILADPGHGWPEYRLDEWSILTGMPTEELSSVDELSTGDAVFWRGSAAAGARYLGELRRINSQVQFWLGPSGGDPVFVERAERTDRVYWATWSDLEYNRWKVDRSPASPLAYLVYRAAQAAIGQTTGAPLPLPIPWHVATYSYDDSGIAAPFSTE